MDANEPKRKTQLANSPIVVEDGKRTVNYGTLRIKPPSHDPWSLDDYNDFIRLRCKVNLNLCFNRNREVLIER